MTPANPRRVPRNRRERQPEHPLRRGCRHPRRRQTRSAARQPRLPNGAGVVGVEERSSDILDLTESMATYIPKEPAPGPVPTPAAPPQFRKIDGHSDVSFAEPAENPPEDMNAVRAHVDGDAGAHRDAERAQLLSRETSAAVDSAFNTLAQTVLVQNARTLEDLVREMLRPMLKTWLDDNLPGVVERLVRAEIERVSRGRG